MADLMRLRVAWSGTPVVGPGLSTFYHETAGSIGFADDVLAFFTAIRNGFPTGITWTVPSNGDQINDATGELNGTWAEPGTGGVQTSSGTVNFANGVGARIVWNTGGIYRGRRVRGSTFLVPLTAGVYLSDGTLDNATVATFQAAADALVAARPNLSVWSRPVEASAGPPPVVGSAGEHNVITSATAVDKVSWLRSRRT